MTTNKQPQAMRAGTTMSLPTVLFLIFLTLKLTGAISWSWWWVTVPLWGSFALFMVFLIIFAAIYMVTGKE